MTTERIVELLEIEHECMRRGAHNKCDLDCARCKLVQDDKELDEMYTGAIALLKEQEVVVPALEQDSDGIYLTCGNCKARLWKMFGVEFEFNPDAMPKFCPQCGRSVKWE